MTDSILTQSSIDFNQLDNAGQAIALAGLGWWVFPCREKPGEPYYSKKDKAWVTPQAKEPYWHKNDLPNGKDNATCDLDQITAWWDRWPDALIGIYCEKSGFFAVDIDCKDDRNGMQSWENLVETYGGARDVEAGPAQRTPSGGYHILFKLPKNVTIPNNSNKLAPGLDLRSNGYICSAGPYRWLPGHDPETHLTDAPAWLVELIRRLTTRASEPKSVGQGNHLASASSDDAGGYWLKRALDQAAPGNRNDNGFWLACQLRDAGLSQSEAEDIAMQYAHDVPGEGYTEREALTSVREAYKAPRREPARRLALSAAGTNGNGHHRIEAESPIADFDPNEAPPMPEIPPDLEPLGAPALPDDDKKTVPTDDELRDRWIQSYPNTAYGAGEWRRYNAGIWSKVPESTIRGEVMGILEAAKPEGVRPNLRLLNSVFGLVWIKVDVAAPTWDADPDILVCTNGVLHIPSRTLLPHDPKYRVTSGLSFPYDPAAHSQAWDRVVGECLGDAADFVQEFAGLALTTDVSFELALWLYGPPGSGKSTVLTGLQTMLGARAGLLGLGDIVRSRFALTNLPGKTLMVSTEQPEDYIATAYTLNQIISGEPITVDRKFKDPVDIIPRAKLAWAMNELPRVSAGGVGLFRRVKVVKFPELPEGKRDPAVKEQVKQAGAAILNWALDGLQRLRARRRFEIPASVQEATEQFKASNDIPATFVTEKCITGPDYRTQGSLLYNAYRTWCIETGHKPQSSTSAAEDWRRLGFEKYLSNGRAFWRGVGLLDG